MANEGKSSCCWCPRRRRGSSAPWWRRCLQRCAPALYGAARHPVDQTFIPRAAGMSQVVADVGPLGSHEEAAEEPADGQDPEPLSYAPSERSS
jgi:hypothetical protein